MLGHGYRQGRTAMSRIRRTLPSSGIRAIPYRSAGKRRTIMYLLLGKLQFNFPNPLLI